MHLLHLSIGSSDTTLANPMHVPSLSLPAFPILRCILHVRIRSFILHFLQTIFFPTVPPLLLVYSAAHALLTPTSLDFQPIIHSPHTSQYTSVSTVLRLPFSCPLLNSHNQCFHLLLCNIPRHSLSPLADRSSPSKPV